MSTRRGFIKAAGGTLAAASAVSAASSAAPDLSFLQGQPLLNREQAAAIMKREGLAAIVCARAANVYYLTNHWPLLERMGSMGSAFAVLPADPAAPVALIMGQFSYYYGAIEDQLPAQVRPFLYTAPIGTEAIGADGVAPARMFRVVDAAALHARERARRAATEAAAPYAAEPRIAVQRALRELRVKTGVIAIDDAAAAEHVLAALPQARVVRGDDSLRRIRRVKSPAEVKLMRIVAQLNAEAAFAAAAATRELGSVRALRRRYYAEAAQRGLRPVFMVVDGVSSDAYDEPLREGQGILIDCVSSLQNYHGDIGRTVFLGEPGARMRTATRAIAAAWDEIRQKLRPGLRYAQIRELGEATLRKHGYDVQVLFNPHGIGLWHGDDPRTTPEGGPVDLALEEGMVLSVDCPVFDQGAGGTAHLEDLALITAQGSELLNDPGQRTILV